MNREKKLIKAIHFGKWKCNTSRLIREEKWEEIKQYEYDHELCNSYFFSHYIESMFIIEGKFSIEAQNSALYLNKNKKLKWNDAAISYPLSMEKLINMIDSGLIDVNYSSYISLAGSFLCYYVPHWKEALEYLFLNGCSVDIQDDQGRNLLIITNSGWDTFSPDNRNYEITKFLLEHGADPLLEDKDGYSILCYAEEDFFKKEDCERLLELIDNLNPTQSFF